MKRSGSRFRKCVDDNEPPFVKAMKHETEEDGLQQREVELRQQDDPIPRILSKLGQHGNSSNSPGSMAKMLQQHKDSMAQLNSSRMAEPRDKLFNSLLVQEVSRHPALFDFTNEEYKSIEARNRHWDGVSDVVGQPLEFVRTRWKTLRDRFKKEVRRLQQNQPGLPWQHYDEMIYLLPFVRDKLEEIPYCAGSGTFEAAVAKQKQTEAAIAGSGNNRDAAQHQPSMNSCTAAILDLAMCAVNNRHSPASDDSVTDQFGVEESSATGSGTAIVNSSSRIHSLHNNDHEQQQNGQTRQSGWNYVTENGEEEDQLFCRIVLKKLGKLEERCKEKAKAKIMEVLVEMQYGQKCD